jgi:hypothetical protein
MKRFFQKHNIDAVNSMLTAGEKLEEKGDLVDAYFLYKALTAIDPECKACRSHMGQVMTKLEKKGIEISIKTPEGDSNIINKLQH